MYDTALLRGKVAVVTGAGHGLGRAYAHALADIGAGIVVDDIDVEAARIVVTEIEETGGGVAANGADHAHRDPRRRRRRHRRGPHPPWTRGDPAVAG